jgi:spoIIIJ-associated protein
MRIVAHDRSFRPADWQILDRWNSHGASFVQALLRDAFLDLSYSVERSSAGAIPELFVEFKGPDVPLLLLHQGELLLALEHMTAKVLLLEPEEHDRLSFEAGGFKARREHDLLQAAAVAAASVADTGLPYAFPPMSSRERRMLHLALTAAGFRTRSVGEGAQRHLVVYPESPSPAAAHPQRRTD